MTSFGLGPRTLTVVKKIVSIGLLVSLIMALFSPTAFAQAAAKQKNASTSKLAQKMKKPQSDFEISATLLQSKPMREEMDQMTIMSLSTGYKVENSLKSTTTLGANLDYVHVWTEYKTENSSQLDTAELTADRTQKLTDSTGLKYGLNIGLPANQVDANAGFNGSAEFHVGLRWSSGIQSVGFTILPKFYNYKFKTSTEGGDEFNKKVSGEAILSYGLQLSDRFGWNNAVRLFEYQNYAGNSYQVYAFSSMLNFKATQQLSILAGVVSRDRVITTNSVLADDVTHARAGLSWSY